MSFGTLKRSEIYKKLSETQEFHNKQPRIEAGDLVREIGNKTYLPDLYKVIESHRRFNKSSLRFIVLIKKESASLRVVEIKIVATDRKFNYLHHDMDVWEYDYRKEKLKFLWSLPHISEFEDFLADPDQFDPKVISDIKKYMKQEHLTSKDVSWNDRFVN